MTTDTPIVEPASTTLKKQIERSAAYPAIGIEDAIPFVESISKNFPGSPFLTRDDVAAVLKTTAANIQRDVAAAAQYRLLNRQKDGYQVAESFKAICTPISEREKRKALLEAFGSPKLYQELISKHDGHAIPPELKTHLIRFHKIAEKVAQEVADIFIKNAKYVGAANEHNILNYKQALAKVSDPNVEYAEIITEDKKSDQNNFSEVIGLPQGKIDQGKQNETLLLPNIPDAENIKIPLSGKRFAYLSYPPEITKRDIEILRKQIDLLELLAE